MNRYALSASTLTAAVGLALALQASAADMPQSSKMDSMHKAQLEKCYGVNAVGKNDCAAGAHSCAGHATSARDPKSYVLLPAGDCSKIAGGSLQPR